MFIFVRFGEDETILCNPRCKVVNLLDHMRRVCRMTESSLLLDLADNSGLIKNLQNHGDEDGDTFLHHQQTYILIGKTPATKDANTDEESVRSDTPASTSSGITLRRDFFHGGDTPHRTPRESSPGGSLGKAKPPSVTPDSRGNGGGATRKKREEAILKTYTPLLENVSDIFPFFKLRLSEDGKPRRKKIRGLQQAGKLVIQEKKTRNRRQRNKSED